MIEGVEGEGMFRTDGLFVSLPRTNMESLGLNCEGKKKEGGGQQVYEDIRIRGVLIGWDVLSVTSS